MEPELQRLGELVVARRTAQGWPTRQAFADNIDLTYRVLTDLENGVRRLGAKAYAVVERALEWRPGSVDRILSGGDPLEVTAENSLLASRLMHPSRMHQTAEWLADDDMAAILQKLLVEGHIEGGDRQRIQDALDDIGIKRFPEVFEGLSRPGKLRVVKFGHDVSTEEYLAQKGATNAIPADTAAATQPDAQTEARPPQEDVLADHSEPGASLFDALPLDPDTGGDSVRNTKHGGDVADSQ